MSGADEKKTDNRARVLFPQLKSYSDKEQAKSPKILCVDDERPILHALKRTLRKEGYEIETSNKPLEALNLVTTNQYDIIISDMRMPEMDGAEFLAAAEKFSPDTIRILLTGYSDQEATIRAINEGKIYGYISKPWSNQHLKSIVNDALNQKFLLDKKRNELVGLKAKYRKTSSANLSLFKQVKQAKSTIIQQNEKLSESHQALVQEQSATIEAFANLINAQLGRSSQYLENLCGHVQQFCETLEVDPKVSREIQLAVQLCPLGKTLLPEGVRKKRFSELSQIEKRSYIKYPELGEQFLLPLVNLHGVAEIIKTHRENVDGSGFPKRLVSEQIPLETKILRVIVDFFDVMRFYDKDVNQACDYLSKRKNKIYDAKVVELWLIYINHQYTLDSGYSSAQLRIDQLAPGMVVTSSLHADNGMLLLSKGTIISHELLKTLEHYERNKEVSLQFNVTKKIELAG